MSRRLLRRFLATLLALGALLAALLWWFLIPRPEDLPLPDTLIALASPEGQALLAEAEGQPDLAALQASWRPQRFRSYCGVASAVAALGAVGVADVDQGSFFTDAASAARSRSRVLFTGMILEHLAALLAAHGVDAEAHFADEGSLEEFLRLATANLAREGDVLLVNYQRAELGQAAGGHISPVAAWAPQSRRLLILDTASTRYPPVWVEPEALWRGLLAEDPESGRSRGFVEVRRR